MPARTAFWRLPGGLLNIDSALTLISFPRRDDADDFFAIFLLLPIYMDYQQYRLLNGFDGMPPLFAVDDAIFSEYYIWIVKDQGRARKRESVLPLIGGVLFFAPFKLHRYTYCITAGVL